jgi:outer membrane biosynthesis protein TonB
MSKNSMYPDSVPVDEPVKPAPKPTPKPAPKPKPEPKPVMYPDSVPVDEPVKKMAQGGTASARADGIAQRGKTNCKIIMCGGGMARGRK